MSKREEIKKELLNDSINNVFTAQAKEKDVQEFYDDLKQDVKAGDVRALSTLRDLVNLIVITYNQATTLKADMTNFISSFIDEARDDNGNGRRYIKHFIQPGKDYDATKFIPTGTNEAYQKVHFIKFKKDDGTLDTNSVQKVFEYTYIEADLITYFVNGQIDTFISEQILSKIEQSLEVFLYDYVMKYVVNTTGQGKEINGTAANLFQSFTNEIFPECKRMLLNSNEYNVDKTLTEAIDASYKDDLVMLCSIKTKTMLESEIISQLFNSGKFNLKDYVGSIHVPNNTFNFAGQTVSVNATQYIPENKIIVFDRRNYVKVLTMLNAQGQQDFPLNLARLVVLHKWLAMGKLPWGKVFTYTNNNLNVSPTA